MKNDNIVTFKKPVFNYDETRDAILGEPDILNIRSSVYYYSPSYVQFTEQQKDIVVVGYRKTLTKLLESDANVLKLHEALMTLDSRIDSIIETYGPESSPFASNNVVLELGNTKYDIHVFQFAYIRFIKAIITYPVEL